MASSSLAPGLLLAAPRLGDPHFERSVVLLAHHDDSGALGWVVNGKPLASVAKLLRGAGLAPRGVDLPERGVLAEPARVGGPVMPGSAWLLFERRPGDEPQPGDHELGGGFAVTSARPAIDALARGEGPTRFRLILGYAGWGPEQLEGEIAAGAWLPADLDADKLLALPPDDLWAAAYHQLVGTTPIAFATSSRGSA